MTIDMTQPSLAGLKLAVRNGRNYADMVHSRLRGRTPGVLSITSLNPYYSSHHPLRVEPTPRLGAYAGEHHVPLHSKQCSFRDVFRTFPILKTMHRRIAYRALGGGPVGAISKKFLTP
ncbi:hypothetical protein GCM10027093_17090 [Paraburkholderia jirisanensis]